MEPPAPLQERRRIRHIIAHAKTRRAARGRRIIPLDAPDGTTLVLTDGGLGAERVYRALDHPLREAWRRRRIQAAIIALRGGLAYLRPFLTMVLDGVRREEVMRRCRIRRSIYYWRLKKISEIFSNPHKYRAKPLSDREKRRWFLETAN